MSNDDSGIFSKTPNSYQQEVTGMKVTGQVILISRVPEMNEDHGAGAVYYRVKEGLWLTESSTILGTGGRLARVADERVIEALEKTFAEGHCSAMMETDGTITWQSL